MNTTHPSPALYIALDLGSTKWTVGLSDGRSRRGRIRSVPAYGLEELLREVEALVSREVV